MDSFGQVTRLLRAWSDGDVNAHEQVVPLVYDTLRRLADRYLANERFARTLQPTALAHEAYLRLVDQKAPDYESRTHFYGVAARVMRQILVDHARVRLSAKRGGGVSTAPLDEAEYVPARRQSANVIALSDALDALAARDARKARIVELRYFGGFTAEETAQSIGISVATIRRETRLAEAFLWAQMQSP
jgi:RNA polymerase sigma-70 factor, ECF subfamily